MTTTKKLALKKAQANKTGNKAIKYIIAGTIIFMVIIIILTYNCTVTFLTY